MLDQLLVISHNIIIIGGALCILLAIGTMIYMIVIMGKFHRLAHDIKQKYELLSNLIISPFRLLQKFFEQ